MSDTIDPAAIVERLQGAVRDVPDFPKPGILFKDITPVLADPDLFRQTIDLFRARYADKGLTKIVGIDARGFIFGAALAYQLGVGFVPVRKKGKLPYQTHCVEYDLEYGSNSVEIHIDAVSSSDKVVIIDDLLATGGTVAAAVELVGKCGATIEEAAFLIELSFLEGRTKLGNVPYYAALTY